MHRSARTGHRTETVILVKAFSPSPDKGGDGGDPAPAHGPRAGLSRALRFGHRLQRVPQASNSLRPTAPPAQTGIPHFYKTHNKASGAGKSLLPQRKVLLQEPGNGSGSAGVTRVFKRSSRFTDQTQKTSHLPCEKMTNASFRLLLRH